VETIGSKRSYALTWCTPNNDDDDDDDEYVYVADVECQVMFSLVTFYCFMCNIALVIFFRTAVLICFND